MRKTIPMLACVLIAGVATAQDGDRPDGYARPADYGQHNDGGDRRDYRRDYDTGPYLGFRVGQTRYNENGLDTITPVTALFIVGAPISPYLGVEGRVGGGLNTADTNGYNLEVRSAYAAYIKGSLPLAPGFAIYGLGGVAAVDLRRDFGLIESHDSGASFGVGMDFNLDRGATLNVEWTRLASGNNLGYDYTVDLASIGLAWHL